MTWSNKFPVLIVGGGIGGLTMANCLQRVGIPYKVIEASPEFGVAGYAVGLAHNAMNCLGKINPKLQERIQNIGIESSKTFKLASNKLVLKVLYNQGPYSKYSPSGFLPMARYNLQKELLHDIPDSCILLNSKVNSFSQNNECITVYLENGNTIQGSILIGADGIKSSVRKTLHEIYPNELGPEPKIRYSNRTLLGGETIITKENSNEINNLCWLITEKAIATLLPIRPENNKQSIFWTIAIPYDKPQGNHKKSNFNEELLKITKIFSKTSYDFPYLINNSKKQIIWDIYELDRKLSNKKWGYKNVTLLGDAAHAVTPWLGQGAGMSIEDAFDLTHRLIQYPDNIPKALETYEKSRFTRVYCIKNVALGIVGIFNILDNPFWRPILGLFYKLVNNRYFYNICMYPLLAYNNPKDPLSKYIKNK